MKTTPFLIALLILNTMVLMGQIWPEGAPPFASIINIITLFLDLMLLITLIKSNLKKS